MRILSLADIDTHLATIEASTGKAIQALAGLGSPTEILRRMKFEKIGRHPIEDRTSNVIEQINQTFTYMVALSAACWLLERHLEAGGFDLASGAHAAQALDIMSIAPDLVGAETFAATSPDSNGMLKQDLKKLATAPSAHRYAFFYSLRFNPGRQPALERFPGSRFAALISHRRPS